MVAALGHDFGKIVAGDGHAQIGADLTKQVFPDLTEAQYKAIAEHMETPMTSLGKATKMADMRNGIVVRDINGKTRI
jgi:metal-dependent HD superfamily phosphatase/phosphodiesterase